jgi:OOP family OmpA-OmpF porin
MQSRLAVLVGLIVGLFAAAAPYGSVTAQSAQRPAAKTEQAKTGEAKTGDVAGARDYPGLPRFRGSAIIGYQALAFDAFRLPTGPAERDADDAWQTPSVLALEGKITGFVYALPRGTATLEVFRNYQDALQAAGFAPLFACDDDQACGDGGILAQRVYVGSHVMQNGGLRSAQAVTYGSEIHYLAAKRVAEGRETYVSLVVAQESNMGGNDQDSVSVVLHVIEPKPMGSSMVFVDAAKMATDIAASGHVTLYGLYFDTDSATVKPDSEPTLKEIAALLTREAGLKLYIVGHTDSQGGYDYNMGLSARRARAVAEVLAARFAIAPDRLHTAGVGLLAPIASNATDDGRAKNRRVELVRE